MQVVDNTLSIREIENKISAGLVEELILQAHNEIKLLRVMKNWKPWEFLATEDYEDKEMMQAMMNFTRGNPMGATFESYDAEKHTPEERQPSAGIHPEDK